MGKNLQQIWHEVDNQFLFPDYFVLLSKICTTDSFLPFLSLILLLIDTLTRKCLGKILSEI